MKRTFMLVLAVAGLSACERPEEKAPAVAPSAASAPAHAEVERPNSAAPTAAQHSPSEQPPSPSNTMPAADNTGKNERDRNGTTLTPGDQKENDADLAITQQIRQGVVKADGLSMAARNVKIITADGVVTLRGPVESAKEKSTIASIAKQAEGAKRIDNQIEVAAK